MRTAFAISTLAATVAAHATFQELWVAGSDEESTCARLPVCEILRTLRLGSDQGLTFGKGNNNPVTSVSTNDIRCNAGSKAAASKCSVAGEITSSKTPKSHPLTSL